MAKKIGKNKVINLDKIDWKKEKRKLLHDNKVHVTSMYTPEMDAKIKKMAKKYKVRKVYFVEIVLEKILGGK